MEKRYMITARHLGKDETLAEVGHGRMARSGNWWSTLMLDAKLFDAETALALKAENPAWKLVEVV